ncbi:MAG: hypothetical protein WAJ86_02775 [Candidatus Acidiferrales bacterium]
MIAAAASALAAGAFVGKAYADDGHGQDHSYHFEFVPGTLVLSRSVYVGNASTVSIGETLPLGCAGGPNGSTTVNVPTTTAGTTTPVTVTCGIASDNGEAPNLFDSHNVWNNSNSDGSFGVTSPIFLDDLTTDGFVLGTLPIPSDQIVTSFSSKSELALNRSIDGQSITLMAYHGGPGCGGFPVSPTEPNLLDVSASNTPGVCDPTNPVITTYQSGSITPTAYYRAVIEVDADGHMSVTDGNAYSGDNGRAAIKGANGLYYMVGNDNSGNLSKKQLPTTPDGINLVNATGSDRARRDATRAAQHRHDRAPRVRHGQARQRHQLPRLDHLQQHAVHQQGQRQQWRQHRLPGGDRGYVANRHRSAACNCADHDSARISQHGREHFNGVSFRPLVRRRQHAVCVR